MTKCRRWQATDPQKLKKLSTVIFRFLLVKAEAEVIGVEAEVEAFEK